MSPYHPELSKGNVSHQKTIKSIVNPLIDSLPNVRVQHKPLLGSTRPAEELFGKTPNLTIKLTFLLCEGIKKARYSAHQFTLPLLSTYVESNYKIVCLNPHSGLLFNKLGSSMVSNSNFKFITRIRFRRNLTRWIPFLIFLFVDANGHLNPIDCAELYCIGMHREAKKNWILCRGSCFTPRTKRDRTFYSHPLTTGLISFRRVTYEKRLVALNPGTQQRGLVRPALTGSAPSFSHLQGWDKGRLPTGRSGG